MSTPTANPTRQQLDELDALLQRMLSLPLNQLEGDLGVASPPPQPPPRPAPPPVGYSTSPAPMPQMPARPAPPQPRPVPPPSDPVPVVLWPLAAVDWVVGKPLSLFGAPGRWLGQGGGKMVAGWVGMLLIAAAVVWGVVAYMGWGW